MNYNSLRLIILDWNKRPFTLLYLPLNPTIREMQERNGSLSLTSFLWGVFFKKLGPYTSFNNCLSDHYSFVFFPTSMSNTVPPPLQSYLKVNKHFNHQEQVGISFVKKRTVATYYLIQICPHWLSNYTIRQFALVISYPLGHKNKNLSPLHLTKLSSLNMILTSVQGMYYMDENAVKIWEAASVQQCKLIW